MSHTSSQHANIAATVHAWVNDFVIAHNLCPFARPLLNAGGLHIEVSPATDFDSAIHTLLAATDTLLQNAAPSASTLVVFPAVLDDFDTFLEAVETANALLEQAGADEAVLLAHFHPDYLFDGEPEHAPSHYTNRAPYPILHLLRQADVSRAVDAYGDTDRIVSENLATMQSLDINVLTRLCGRPAEH